MKVTAGEKKQSTLTCVIEHSESLCSLSLIYKHTCAQPTDISKNTAESSGGSEPSTVIIASSQM